MASDEGPGPEDLRRFGGDTAYCPACGAEIWDEAPFCPDCGADIGGRTLSEPPQRRAARHRFVVLTALLAAAGLLLLVLRLL